MSRRDDRLVVIVTQLHRLIWTPTAVLADLVTRDGLCFWAFTRGDVPGMAGEQPADRELAVWLCAGCQVQNECLELELRDAGPDTVGVWGGLTEDDRRALYPLWIAREDAAGGAP